MCTRSCIYPVIGISIFKSLLMATIINIPNDYPTIGQDIEAANNGDTILVELGIYNENINYWGKNIILGSQFVSSEDTSYITNTVIKGDSNWSTVTFKNGEDIDTNTRSTVVVDTFTGMKPIKIQVYPRAVFNFDILHAFLEQVESDLYVSPEGDDTNSGQSPEEPLRTITAALTKITADSLNPHTIYLADGVYSPSTNGEQYPLNMVNYVSLVGESEHGVILDAEEQLRVLWFNQNRGITVSSLTVTGGRASGIFCSESSPNLNNITIRDNRHYYNGGGISLSQSSPSMLNVTIRENRAYDIGGGGIDCGNNSNPTMENVVIINNSAFGSEFYLGNGGGIRCWGGSNPTLRNVTISGNTARANGSGIFLDESDLSVVNTIIWNASPHDQPQEIYFSPSHGRSSITVSSSDIQGGVGSILTNNNGSVDWQDNNTSENPLFCEPDSGDYTLAENSPCAGSGENGANMGAFEVGCYASLVGQVESDLYVTPEGADTNSGKTSLEPLKTISYALAIIKADSLHPHTIFLENGTYSPSTNGEQFPLYLVDNVSLSGESESGVILDAEKSDCVLIIDGKKGVTIENMMITGGAAEGVIGGGVSCYDSNPTLKNLKIYQNSTSPAYHRFNPWTPYGAEGGGICLIRSNPRIVNVQVYENEASHNGGGISCFQSNPILENVVVSGNTAIGWDYFYGYGGGIYCNQSNPSLENVIIYNNTTLYQGGGIHCHKSSPSLKNVTVTNNTVIDTSWYRGGGGISVASNSSPSLLNTILWNNISEIHFDVQGDSSRITISYSDVEGGRDQVETNDNGTVDWQDGNISVDPLFCDPDSGDYNLAANSPCRGRGKNRENIGALGVGCNFIPGPEYPDLPLSYELYQNFPNPFNQNTTLWYALPENTHVTITIYNIRGQLINTVVDRPVDEGYNSIIWNGNDDSGRPISTGIYIYQIIAGDFIQTRKMVLLK